MPVRKYKPTSPGQRQLVKVDRAGLHKGKPEQRLLEKKIRGSGRNNARCSRFCPQTVKALLSGKRTKMDSRIGTNCCAKTWRNETKWRFWRKGI
mgnify:CR=1 FL=1